MIRVVQTDFSDGQLEQWWNEKYRRETLVTDTVFQSWSWNYCWWKHFIDPDPTRELFLLKALDGDDIVAVAPWFIQRRKIGGFLLWNYMLWIANELSPYPDLIIEKGTDRNAWESFLKFCLTQHRDIWFIFNDMHPRSSINNLHLEGYESSKKQSNISLRLDFTQDSADIDGFHPNLRRGLKKALREYHSSGEWAWEIHAPSSLQDREMLKKLCNDRFGSKSFFRISGNTAFFYDLAKRMEEETFCSLLSKRGNVASIVMGFIHHNVFYYFLSGMNESFEEVRPGLLNLYLLIEHAQNNGYRAFDFLKGEERYKKEFSASREELSQYLIIPEKIGMRIKLYSFVQSMKNAHHKLNLFISV